MVQRIDQRQNDELRPCKFQCNYLKHPKGSVLIEQGNTRVICAVSVVPGVPRWMKNQGVSGGWLTSEYQMLPGATSERSSRDINRGRLNGRAQEIQRLIGRSLRAVVNLEKLGANTVYVDCDVIDADGGTRCASINGAAVALQIAFREMMREGAIDEVPLIEQVAAISVGIKKNTPLLDLCYIEDSSADVDMNIVMTESGKFIEVQGTAESGAFSRKQMDEMLDFASSGIKSIIELQKQCLSTGL